MQLVKLSVYHNGQYADRVPSNFHYGARLFGNALVYWAYSDAFKPGEPRSLLVPEQGDGAIPTIEMLDPVIAGITPGGRLVTTFRSGNRKPNTSEWDGTASLFAAVGGVGQIAPDQQAIIVQTTQPGPQGPMGPAGAKGPAGPPGPQGEEGAMTDEQMSRLAEMTAERVFSLPPAADHFAIPPEAQSGTRFQDMTTILLLNQAVWQGFIKAIDEAALNLLQSGYKPKVG